MAYRTLELTLISANDLEHVTLISKMEVYAISSINGYPSSQQLTPADREGGTSPVWNITLSFSIPPGDPSNHFLHVLLRCHRALGDRDIGEVRIPFKELLDCFAEGRGDRKFVSYQVRNNSSSKVGGVLNLSYKFLDAAPLRADEPVRAYPYVAGPRMGATYPPTRGAPPYAQPYMLPAGYGFIAPAPAGYGFIAPAPAGYGFIAPAPAGYGRPPVGYGYGATRPASARPARNNRFGMLMRMRMGTQLVGDALAAGLLIGDMISGHHTSGYNSGYHGGDMISDHHTSGYNSGYHGGYGDGDGFDGGYGDGDGFDDSGSYDDGGVFDF